ncbi:hypothetical protein BCR34DRAFT_601682 [Clohesyomyces aquaticus]|uniref:Ubiquitin 3 binding protein But2 C-terminal domain-containing protein n=1 Tax=Clohesyomyces aquaticus TaxID=1231657 RepID=A0A1Y1ZL23_9PLEO|nr:hypothetical protein BCR34DRAFT_601682 [Clohesyomyces aquaticus]
MLSTLLLLPLLAMCSPTSNPQFCKMVAPTFVQSFGKLSPAFVPPESGKTVVYKDSHEPSPNYQYYGHVIDTLIEFSNMPSSVYRCNLQIYFEKGFSDVYVYDKPVSFNVWSTAEAAPKDPSTLTWDNAPKPMGLVAEVKDFPLPIINGELRGYPSYANDTLIPISAVDCHKTMTFRISIPDGVAHGGVQFRQTTDGPDGWKLQYCATRRCSTEECQWASDNFGKFEGRRYAEGG